MKEIIRKMDKPLLFLSLALLVFGLVMIFSASSYTAVLQYGQSEYFFFRKQLITEIVGLILFMIVAFIPSKKYGSISKLSIISIIGVFIAMKTYGTVTNSARSWLPILGMSFQPSEFAKTIIIVYLACWYGAKKKFDSITDILLPMIPCAVIFFLVAMEPDLGTAAIIAIICLFIFFTLPIKNRSYNLFRLFTLVVIVGGIIFVNVNDSLLTNTQSSRFNFHAPCSRYLEETGYQVCNGYIAIHNGGVTGVGLGKSTQKYLYLPESYTDFIFPIIVEELGIIGGSVVFILYMSILYRILVIARNAKNLKNSIIAFGTFAYILTHIIINMGGLLALMPLTGVPLPFLSYGGSFIVNLLVLLGLTQRVAIENREGEIRKNRKAKVVK